MLQKVIYTIGHSTRPAGEFISLLKSARIGLLADIRQFPGSARYPQFNSAALAQNLAANDIAYIHMKDLGGRRRPKPDSHNNAWRVEAFRGYADYMETPEFQAAAFRLEELAVQKLTAYMCSEAVWWGCHRALLSDYLKSRGWTVLHIMSHNKHEEHPWTKAARIVNNQLSYRLP